MRWERAQAGRRRWAGVLGLLVLLGGSAAGANELEWVLDPSQSLVRFSLGARLHTVEGTMTVTEGLLRFPEAGGPASGRIVVDATSAQTGNSRRDANMHGDVLESARHPEIVFAAEHLRRLERAPARDVEGPRSFDVELQGTLAIHGSRVPLTIPATVTRDGNRAVIDGSFTAPYVDWGLAYVGNFLLPIDEEARVDVTAVGRLRSAEPASSGGDR